MDFMACFPGGISTVSRNALILTIKGSEDISRKQSYPYDFPEAKKNFEKNRKFRSEKVHWSGLINLSLQENLWRYSAYQFSLA